MLPDEIVLPICHRWAKIIWRPGLDYDELVAIAYCFTKPLPDNTQPWVVGSWAKWKLLKFVNATNCVKAPPDSSFDTRKHFLTMESDRDSIIDIQQAIGDLSDMEAQLIYMRFWRDMKLEEIAASVGRSRKWVTCNIERVLGILRLRLLR